MVSQAAVADIPEPALQRKKRVQSPNAESNDASREPPIQHKKRVDVTSLQSAQGMEPPLQRKKRSQSASPTRAAVEPSIPRRKKVADSNSTPYGVYFTPSNESSKPNEEFVLLGDQSKFAQNVVYRVRSRSALQRDIVRKEAATQAELNTRLSVPPARRVVVDTGKPASRASRSDGDHVKKDNRDTSDHVAKKVQVSSVRSDSEIPPTPMAPRGPAPQVFVETGKPSKPAEKSGTTKSAGQKTDKPVVDREPVSMSNAVPEVKGEKRLAERKKDLELQRERSAAAKQRSSQVEKQHKANSNNSAGKEVPVERLAVSAKVDKQVDANVERDKSDYAWKYRHGLIPPRSSATGPKRTSEYQRQFQWKSFERNSPLVAAEEIVYRSHPDLTSLKLGRVAEEESEYRSQFQPWTASSARGDEHQGTDDVQKLKRSKSLRVLKSSAAKARPAGIQSRSHSDSESHSEQRDQLENAVDDGKKKPEVSVAANYGNFYPSKLRSEYSSNFKPPWKLLGEVAERSKAGQDQEQEHVLPAADNKNVADWYAEVLELRRHAQEYRRRAYGTHFSRDHLAQLCARNAQLWDTVSNSSISSSRSTTEPQKEGKAVNGGRQAVVSPPSIDYDADDQQQQLDDDVIDSEGETTPSVSVASNSERRPQSAVVTRHHHLTRTTPIARDGPLLVPRDRLARTQADNGSDVEDHFDMAAWREDKDVDTRHRRSKSAKTSKRSMRNSSVQVDIQRETRDVVENIEDDVRHDLRHSSSKTRSAYDPGVKLLTHGLPTRDSHVLADATNTTTTSDVNRPIKRDVVNNYRDDDDEAGTLSTARSIASSCSLASEVLARARSRRDEFWK